MSSLFLTLAVDNAATGNAIGVKEAIAMDLEKYGDVTVLRVEAREPEQLRLGGGDPGLFDDPKKLPLSYPGQLPNADRKSRPEPGAAAQS